MEKPLWMISITHMFVEIFLLIQVALIPVITQEFQLSLLEASLVASLPSIVTLVMNIPSGYLADHFPKSRFLPGISVVIPNAQPDLVHVLVEELDGRDAVELVQEEVE